MINTGLKCLECNEEFYELKTLHFHIARKHKKRIEEYYRRYFPRYDLLTNEPIRFKSYEFYVAALFNDRASFLEYIKKNISNEQLCAEIFYQLLDDYRAMKGAALAPGAVESKSTILPNPSLARYMNLDYNSICSGAHLKPRFKYDLNPDFDDIGIVKTVLVDTREQKPLSLPTEMVKTKLDFGDYACRDPYRKLFVERKSLIDLCGTLSAGYDRFNRELTRARSMGVNLLVCVESPLFSLTGVGKGNLRKVRASSEFLYHRIREICRKYENTQFLFLKDRSELSRVVMRVFAMKSPFLEFDMQYLYDSRLL